jgi:hypothetical protein
MEVPWDYNSRLDVIPNFSFKKKGREREMVTYGEIVFYPR